MPIADLILLFFASLFAAIVSGAAGFGGALLLLPVVTNIVGVKAAIPILTIAQIIGNASRVAFNWRELKWKPIFLFLLTAMPFAMVGSYLFSIIDAHKIKAGVGLLLILLVIYRRFYRKTSHTSEKGMLIGGGVTGFISGIAGSAGPLGAAFFLGLGLTPTAYIASEALTAFFMHVVKITMYNRLAFLGQQELVIGLFVGVAMIIGSWLGKMIIVRLPQKTFILIVEALLVISGIQLIFSFYINKN